MEKILIDTDVIIDFLRGYKDRIRKIFLKIENKEIKAYISLISIVELYAGKNGGNKEKETALVKLLSFFEIIPLDYNLSKLAGRLKRKYNLGLADSIIAATSQKLGARIFTFNIKHFRNLSEIAVYEENRVIRV